MIAVGFIVVILAAYIFYFIIPYISSTAAATKMYNDAQSQLNLLKTKQTMSVQLKGEIDDLNNQLKSDGAAVPTGIDHARILLYLKKITDGRTENLTINVPKDPDLTNRFLVQGVTLDFQTTYPEFLSIIGDLKKNELFSRVSYLKINYSPKDDVVPKQPDDGNTGSGQTISPQDTPTPITVPDKNVFVVHIELNFYAMQPSDSNTVSQPIAPTTTARTNILMPEN